MCTRQQVLLNIVTEVSFDSIIILISSNN